MVLHGILQADAYGGYNDLYRAGRSSAPITSALCWSHARRKFFELADIAGNVRKGKPAHEIAPVSLEAVARIDPLFESERRINGMSPRSDWQQGREACASARRRTARLAHGSARADVEAQSRRKGDQLHCSRRRVAGRPSLGSSLTAGSAFRTMPPSALCAVSLWGERRGGSPVPSAAVNAPYSCIP